jgi:hypothetical protein
MRLDDLEVSAKELEEWAGALDIAPDEEFDLAALPFGKPLILWLDQTIFALLERGRDRALNDALTARVALRAIALSRMTGDPRPAVAFKVAERWLVKVLAEFGCRI